MFHLPRIKSPLRRFGSGYFLASDRHNSLSRSSVKSSRSSSTSLILRRSRRLIDILVSLSAEGVIAFHENVNWLFCLDCGPFGGDELGGFFGRRSDACLTFTRLKKGRIFGDIDNGWESFHAVIVGAEEWEEKYEQHRVGFLFREVKHSPLLWLKYSSSFAFYKG